MKSKRKTLIKMKNGRHRVATASEVELQERVDAAAVRESNLREQNFTLRHGRDRAREEGMNMILEQQHLPAMLEAMTFRLADALGKELAPHAEKLMKADRTGARDRRLLLRALIEDVPIRDARKIIEGVIPALHYRMVLA